MLTGIVTSATSKHLPGPGSHIAEQILLSQNQFIIMQQLNFFWKSLILIEEENSVIIKVDAFDEEDELVITGTVTVIPPKISGSNYYAE